MRAQFGQWECEVQFSIYTNNNRLAIFLIDALDKSPVATATCNVVEEPLEQGEVIIKDYSENEGMLVALIDANIVKEPTRYIYTGFVQCPVCQLTEPAKKEAVQAVLKIASKDN